MADRCAFMRPRRGTAAPIRPSVGRSPARGTCGRSRRHRHLHRRSAQGVQETKRRLLTFLIDAKESGQDRSSATAPRPRATRCSTIAAFARDFLDYTVDRSPHKQGKFLPGTHIPIYVPTGSARHKPDYLLILPWNLKDEIMAQMRHIREWGGRFVVPIPGRRSSDDVRSRTAMAGAYRSTPDGRMTTRVLRAYLCERDFWSTASTCGGCNATSRSIRGRHAARAALPGGALAKRSWCAVRLAPSSMSSLIFAPGRPRLCSTSA